MEENKTAAAPAQSRGDLFDKCRAFTRAKEMMHKGCYPYFTPLHDTEGSVVTVDDRRLVMAGSNNYLGLTTHPKVRLAAMDALARYGTSCTGSRFLNGTLDRHQELDRRMAGFVGKEAAICFSTGYQTNLGVISALVGRNDIVVADKEAHASVVDGCGLSRGTMKRFSHNDVDHLDYVLEKNAGPEGVLVVVDGVYSMGGDIAPLPELLEVTKRRGARLLVDDAHSLGVLGKDGRGTADHFGVTDEVDLIMGTFSKSCASLGGVIAGDENVIHFIQHTARSLIFSASMPAANVAAVLAAVEVMETEPEWMERLWSNTHYMHQGLRGLGFDIGPTETPVIPVILGDDELTIRFWQGLYEEGVYTNPVLAPAVPPGGQRLRTSYMATHTREHLNHILRAFEEVGVETGVIARRAAQPGAKASYCPLSA
ncbi:MAG: pyridoxal phosphate-dependent aminotransferase family protein [Candidatus Hydrogenedentes bacterium]|nr:pyridoxal phosphate-dependent aminotransferase family protein [Candidatus Hydrogenedentota bacterium]